MPVIRFETDGGPRLGTVAADAVTPLELELAPGQGVEALLSGGVAGARRLIAERAGGESLPLAGLRALAPVPRPSKIFGVGLNYAGHVAESKMPMPEVPAVFAKFPSSVCGPGDPILQPRASQEADYEGELCIVIGRTCRNVPAARAAEAIGGYTILNDVSVRDLQLRTQHWSLGKSFDSHSPTGPWVALGDELDPGALSLRTWINGELRQDSNTSELIFDCATLVEFISGFCTLYPGDLIATGTPGGVGGAMSPPDYLDPGDEVRIEIEGLGALVNPVELEAADNAWIGEEKLGAATS